MENSLLNIISHSLVRCLVSLPEIFFFFCDSVDKLRVGKVEVVKEKALALFFKYFILIPCFMDIVFIIRNQDRGIVIVSSVG